MKILLFTDADVFAGTERHIAALADELVRLGVAVSIACPDPSPLAQRARSMHVQVIPIRKRGLIDFAAIKVLRRQIRDGSVDLIHAHNGRTALLGAIAVAAAGRGRCVYTQHFLEPHHTGQRGPKGWLAKMAHALVDRNTNQVIAISQAVAEKARGHSKAMLGRLRVVRNGLPEIDPSTLTAASSIRERLSIAEHDCLIVCIARLEPEKDVATLIAAMEHLLHSGRSTITRNSHCLIAGEGKLHDELARDIKRRSIGSQVGLLGFQDDPLSLLNAADVFVLPSVAEPFGLVILEAMALAKPVIAVDSGGPREIVVNGSTGLLVPPGNAVRLASAIGELVADSDRSRTLGQAGYLRFINEFTARRMAVETIDVYRKAVGTTDAEHPEAELAPTH